MPIDTLLASLRTGGRDFEHLCKWLLENVPEYSAQLKQVWLWDDWPKRRGRDIGIDLVAEDREGGLWAVQAKHYHPAYSVKKADLDSFLSASSRAEFTYRLLVATTDHVGANARATIAIQEKPVGMLLRSQLDALEVVWPLDCSAGHSVSAAACPLSVGRPTVRLIRLTASSSPLGSREIVGPPTAESDQRGLQVHYLVLGGELAQTLREVRRKTALANRAL